MNTGYVKPKEKFAFAISGGGQNFCYALVTNYLMYYYINVLNINAKTVGLMLLVAGIWDIVNNPLAGIIIDKTRTKHGKMVPYIRWFSAPLALFTVLLFSGNYILGDASFFKIFYMVLTYFGWEICYTFTDVAYWGISSVISPDSEERTRILTSSNLVLGIMSVIPQVLVPVFMDLSNFGGSFDLSQMFFVMGLIGGIFGIGLFSLSGYCVKERIEQSQEMPSIKESLFQLVKNPILRTVITANLLYSISGIGVVFSKYYFIDVLGLASFSVISQIPYFVFGFVSFALIKPLKKRLTGKQLMIMTFLGLGFLQLFIYFAGTRFYGNAKIMLPLIMIYYGVYGLFSSLLSVIPTELLGDATDYSEWTTGKRNEGVSFSLKITTTKIQGTITQSFSAILLSMIGYLTSSDSSRVLQPESVKQNLWMMYFLVPAVITIICAVPYFFYPMTEEKRKQMQKELNEKRG